LGQPVYLPEPAEGDYTLLLDLPPAEQWPAEATVRVVFDRRSDREYHSATLTRDGLQLEEAAGGETRRLRAGAWPVLTGPRTFHLKRRRWEIEALCNGRVVARAHDELPYGGQVGLEAQGLGLTGDDLALQPVEPPSLTDDFMRGPDEANPWERLSGNWQIVGLAGGKGGLRPDLSANPFSLRCTGPGVQLATAGDWFWDSCSATVAAKAAAPTGAVGLACYVQDARNYYLLSCGGPGQSVTLAKVVDGRVQALDSGQGGYEKDLWLKLTLRASNGVLEGFVDGDLRVWAYDETFGEGPVGLWAGDAGDAWFDDVAVSGWWAFADPLNGPELSAWLQGGGRWESGSGALRAAGTEERPGNLIVGPQAWRNYEMAADITPREADGVGVYACANGLSNWYLFHWSPGDPTGSFQLLKMVDGRLSCLGVWAGDLDRDGAQRMSLSVVDGLVECRVDGQPVFQTADFALSGGAAGLRVDGVGRAEFAHITVRGIEDTWAPAAIAAQFAQEETMADWARPGSDWPRDLQTGGAWFRLPVFGDLSLRFPYRPAPAGSRVTVRLGAVAQGETYMPGAVQPYVAGMEIECAGPVAGPTTVTCRRGGEVLAQTQVAGQALMRSLRIDKAGLGTRVWLDDAPVFAVHDATWLDSSGVGLSGEGAAINLSRTQLRSTHLLDWTFSGAPTDWRPTLGVWQVTDRWSCFPGWAWFGGSKHASPLCWSKRQFYGDQVFEFWGALEMDAAPNRGGYLHPSDINCTIAGDGRNLCSGYSFVFAGDNNTTTKILRGNAVVAQTNGAHFTQPNTGNMDFHRHWFHVQAVKQGADLYMAVDGKYVLQWRDPQPLPGGHVAVWSYNNNGLLVARARASAQLVR
jgi:hypothetical protein